MIRNYEWSKGTRKNKKLSFFSSFSFKERKLDMENDIFFSTYVRVYWGNRLFAARVLCESSLSNQNVKTLAPRSPAGLSPRQPPWRDRLRVWREHKCGQDSGGDKHNRHVPLSHDRNREPHISFGATAFLWSKFNQINNLLPSVPQYTPMRFIKTLYMDLFYYYKHLHKEGKRWTVGSVCAKEKLKKQSRWKI